MLSLSELLNGLRAIWPVACAALLIAAVCAHWGALVLARAGLASHWRSRPAMGLLVLVLALLAALPWVPISGHRYSLASLWISILSETATLSALLVGTSFAAKPRQWAAPRFLWPLVLAALGVYAGVLFEAGPDLYRWGYASSGLAPWTTGALLIVLALWAWCLPAGLAWLPAAAVLAWALGLQGSPNLWDYLFDLPLFILLLATGLWQLSRRRSAP